MDVRLKREREGRLDDVGDGLGIGRIYLAHCTVNALFDVHNSLVF
jgi:hypothetical protein